MDPVSLALLSGALGGVGGKVVETVWNAAGKRWLADYFHDHPASVREEGLRNTLEFLSALAKRVGSLEDRVSGQTAAAERALGHPDFAGTMKSAMLGAARTDDPLKHDVLARAVVERLHARPESLQALAANIAVDVLPRLSPQHIHLLGIAAAVDSIRPAGLPLSLESEGGFQTTAEEAAALRAYVPWLAALLEQLPLDGMWSEADYAHLAAAACLIVERGAKRSLEAALSPFGGRRLSWAAAGDVKQGLEHLLYTTRGNSLRAVWEAGLQSVVLTPTGLLIGSAAVAAIAGQDSPINWALPVVSSTAPIDDSVWEHGSLKREFMEALEREVSSRASRGVYPWRPLGH